MQKFCKWGGGANLGYFKKGGQGAAASGIRGIIGRQCASPQHKNKFKESKLIIICEILPLLINFILGQFQR